MGDYFVEKDDGLWTLGYCDSLLMCPYSPAGIDRCCGSWCAQFRIRLNKEVSTDQAIVVQGCIELTTQVAIEDLSDACQSEEV